LSIFSIILFAHWVLAAISLSVRGLPFGHEFRSTLELVSARREV
jgi:hypothetical protein